MSERYTPVEPLPYEDFDIPQFKDDSERPFELGGNSYHRISEHHGRSLERSEINNRLMWGKTIGDFTILFGASSEKGIPSSKPDLYPDNYNHTGIRANGLVTQQGLTRSMEISNYVNGHGLPSESFRTIRILESVTIDGKIFSQKELKEEMLKEWANKAKTAAITFDFVDVEAVDGVIKRATDFVDQHNFYTVERDYQVGERFRDMDSILDSKEHTTEVFAKIFKWLNIERDLEQKKPGTYSSLEEVPGFEGYQFKPTEEDITKYIIEYLPRKMGQYLAKLHNLKIAHGFATDHNWSMVGTLYDMDGASGLAFDGIDPDEKQQILDLEQTFVALAKNTWDKLGSSSHTAKIITEKYEFEGMQRVLENFKNEYVKFSDALQEDKQKMIEKAALQAFPNKTN